jgi:hypothetical protein
LRALSLFSFCGESSTLDAMKMRDPIHGPAKSMLRRYKLKKS